MIKITVSENQGNQRLDRFLKKYFPKAPLGYLYRLVRKDAKVNGSRRTPEYMLRPGDELTLYISEEEAAELSRREERPRAKKQFSVIYEDENLLAVSKPFGLLTHGDGREKKDHLANQVLSYLIESGQYEPRRENTFTPSPANRLDRNTTGLVLFGKTAEALRELNAMIRERNSVGKYYAAIACGKIEGSMRLLSSMVKDERRNVSMIADAAPQANASQTGIAPQTGTAPQTDASQGKLMDTEVFPQCYSPKDGGYTLLKLKINTGRTHQIRVQLAACGHPLIGDAKYGLRAINETVKKKYGLSTQLLHAESFEFSKCRQDGPLWYMQGKRLECPLPENFRRIKAEIFGENQ